MTIETFKIKKGRIRVTNLKTQEKTFGALNIGKLTITIAKTMKNEPIFKNEKGEFVYCGEEMKRRIDERLIANR